MTTRRNREEEMQGLLAATRAVLENRGLESTARKIFDGCKILTGATAGYVALLSDDGAENEVLFLDAGGEDCTVDESLPMPIRGLRGISYETGRAVYDNDFMSSEWVQFMPEGHAPLKNVLFAPLPLEGKVVGLMGLANKPGEFDDDDARIATAFAEIAAMALSNSRLVDRIRRANELNQTILETLPLGLDIVAEDGTVLFANEELKSWVDDDPIGGTCFANYRDDGQQCTSCPLRSNIVLGETKTVEVAGYFGGRSFQVTHTGIMYEGTQAVLEVFVDLTEHKRMQQELLKSAKLESVGTLAGGIAHQFNNLLTGVLTNLSLARTEVADGDDPVESLTEAEQATRQASALTSKLLTFARGGAPIRREASLPDLLRETVHFVLSGSRSRASISIADDLWNASIDPDQISRVVENLVINASEAMPQGGTIDVRAENVSQGADRSPATLAPGRYVRLSVRDHGPGIPARHLEHIFDPFFTTKQDGSGMGLAAAHSIVDRHKGHLSVQSSVGEGSTFSLLLPATSVEPHSTKSLPSIEGGEIRVLVMDDEELIRRSVTRLLERRGYEVTTAAEGDSAVRYFSRAIEEGRPFDLVILDLTIPGGKGGREVIAELRAIDPDVRAVVSSGYSDDPLMSDFEAHGFVGVAAKPYEAKDLYELVESLKARRRG